MPEGHDEGGDLPRVCSWISEADALSHFATYDGPTQSQQHIKPLHWYVACRLVLEGGFHPDDITPRPPFVVTKRKKSFVLSHDPSTATGGEQTVLGGLKTKNVDVVVTKKGLGPVMAVSCKGMTGAFRNLTNRMEETIGECTNLHITYPALVFGYLFVIRANKLIEEAVSETSEDSAPAGKKLAKNDIAMQEGGQPVESIFRFHSALRELAGRRGIRNDVSRYEAVSLAMVDLDKPTTGDVLASFPKHDSPLRIENFFETMYLRYDERFVYAAPDLKKVTERIEWAPDSPVFSEMSETPTPALNFAPRLSND